MILVQTSRIEILGIEVKYSFFDFLKKPYMLLVVLNKYHHWRIEKSTI
jgi:hypothetical protein